MPPSMNKRSFICSHVLLKCHLTPTSRKFNNEDISSLSNLRKLATKIENRGDKWLTCILYPELPMDNNEAERSLRPFVIIRKIIGCLRSEIGMKNYEIMMSLISTWQK